MSPNNTEIEKRLWEAADELRANSKLRSSEYSTPVLGLVFLKWADYKFSVVEEEFQKKAAKSKRSREIGKADYHAKGVMYLPDESRFSYLMKLPENSDIGKTINDAMEAIETDNPDLRGVLPRTYREFDNRVLLSLLRIFNSITMDESGDVFGKVYEYFLGKFAMAEGQRGGQFFTPTSIVSLIVEILEPFHGRIYDPACGSGGMFVQSARFIEEHKGNPSELISIYGQERISETVRLCKMNLAVHGLPGDIRQGNTYYKDIHESPGKFDFVMANPPFNVDKVNKDRIKTDPRFVYGIPSNDNANFLWIQIFLSSLNTQGRAGFVMANSAGDARGTEYEIRKEILENHYVDIIIAIAPKFFYTVSLPCTLWFFDKGKQDSNRKEKVLFIDARTIFRDIDRAHRDFSSKHIEFISNIVKLFRGEEVKHDIDQSIDWNGYSSWDDLFPGNLYQNIPGLCKIATMTDIQAQDWSLNPGRYVGTSTPVDNSEAPPVEVIRGLLEEFEVFVLESHTLGKKITRNLQKILKEMVDTS